MKKFLSVILTVLLLMSVTNVFANPDMAQNTNYLYLIPQEDGSVLFVSKFMGVANAGVVFDVPADATNLKVVSGSELKDGKVVSLAPDEKGKVEYHYNVVLKNNEFNYVTPLANTTLTMMAPEGKGLISSTDVALEGDTSAAGDFNMDGLNDYFFAALIPEANKPVKFIYDRNAKPSAGSSAVQKPTQNNTQEQEKDTTVTPAENSNTTLFIVLGTLGVVVIAGVGLYFYFRSQKGNSKTSYSSDDENEDDFVKLAQQRKVILGKISELQENLEAGVITAEEHSEKEKVLREKLLKVTVNIKNFTE
ncbi:MAG: hypothetical protein K0R18_2424 [Bacillales bacterium]|jgi:hypothetical protein|nr:hypothetical protein [Bacillales bacterium]